MTDGPGVDPPSPFITRWIRRLGVERAPGARALDMACGRGRHLLALATAGYHTLGVDIRLDALTTAQVACRTAGVRVALLCTDLTCHPLPSATFDLVVVSRYLDRDRFPALLASLTDGGVLLYETFTEGQLRYARGPRSRAHLLQPGELRRLVRGMEVIFDEEVTEPAAVARIAARKRTASDAGLIGYRPVAASRRS